MSRTYDWKTLLRLFDEISALPKEERAARIGKQQLDEATLKKLQQMLDTLEHTVSLLDKPISSKIQFEEDWFAEKWVGQKLNGYVIESLLHASGITGVFKASQKEPVHREVVLKLLRPDTPSEYVDFFRFEQLALAKLTHPNIAAIHTVEKTDEGLSFIVMEYIEGTLLSAYCDQKTLTISERLKVFLRICDAITYSHQRGVLHRDLKSSNILVRNFQGKHTPTIIDFGISSDLNNQTYLDQNQVFGTPEYMSPEHVLNVNDMDARADVYSLGMLLFNLLVGPIPFCRETISGMEQAKRISLIAEFAPLAPSVHYGKIAPQEQSKMAHKRGMSTKSYHKSLSTDLDFIFLKATQKNKEHRYQSVAELSADLRLYLNHKVVSAHPPSYLYQIKKFIVRNSIASFATLCMTVLASLFMIKLIDQNHDIKAEFLRAQTEKQNAEQISVMVMDTLGVANPKGVKSQGKASVESMVDQTFESLINNNEISPDFRAKLLVKLSQAYRGINNVPKAQKIESLLLNEIDSYTPDSKVNALLTLADSAELDTDHYAGLTLAKKAHDICLSNRIQGLTLVKSKGQLARAHILLSEFEKAETLLNDALALINQDPNPDTVVLANLYSSLADMAIAQSQFGKAEGYYKQGKDVMRQQYGDNHARVVEFEIDEAQLLVMSRSPKATTEYIENVYKKIIAIWGENSKNANTISYHLATAYKAKGELKPAIHRYRENLKSLQAQGIEYDVIRIANMIGLTGAFLESGDHKDALDVASELHQKVTQKNDLGIKFTPYQIAMTQSRYSNALAANAMFEEALIPINSAIRFFKEQSEIGWAHTLSTRAYIRAKLGQTTKANDDIKQASVLFDRKPEEHNDKSLMILLTQALQLYIDLSSNWNPESFDSLTSIWNKSTIELDGNTIEFPYSEIGRFVEERQLLASPN